MTTGKILFDDGDKKALFDDADKKVLYDPCISIWKLDSGGNLIWHYDTRNHAHGAAVDGSGNLYVVGLRRDPLFPPPATTRSFWKFNSSGVLQSVDCDIGTDASGVAVDSSGNIYIAGTRVSIESSYRSVWKFNSAGVEQWHYDLGTHGRKIAVDSSGNVYVTGSGSLFKLNSSGAWQWTFTKSAALYGVAVDGSDDIYVKGAPVYPAIEQFWKLDSAKNTLWSKQSYYEQGYTGRGVCVDGSQNPIIGTNPSSWGEVMKFNSSGIFAWKYETNSYVYDLAADSSANIYAVGTNGTDEDSGAGTVRKFNSSGVKQWGYDTLTTANAVAIDSSGNVYIAGNRRTP